MQIKESHAPLTGQCKWNTSEIWQHTHQMTKVKKKTQKLISVASRENGVAVQKIVFPYE